MEKEDTGSDRTPEVPDPRELLLDEEDPMDEGGGDGAGMDDGPPATRANDAVAAAAAVQGTAARGSRPLEESAKKSQEVSVPLKKNHTMAGMFGIGAFNTGNEFSFRSTPNLEHSHRKRIDPLGSPAGGSGSMRGSVTEGDEPKFPPAYNIIRAGRVKALEAARLGALGRTGRTATVAKIGYFKGGLLLAGDSRPFMVQNYHCRETMVNVSLTVGKTTKGGVDELSCLSCPAPHSISGRMAGDGLPGVFLLADQSFPAVLPVSGGDCTVVVRVEDGRISDLEQVFLDRLKAFTRPHGTLPAGSVVLIGSLSHLAAFGLADYTENLVSSIARLSVKLGTGTTVAPLIFMPMHGVESAAVVRSMMDLDAWLLSMQGGGYRCCLRRGFCFGKGWWGGWVEGSLQLMPTQS